jgi:hypothetical protein
MFRSIILDESHLLKNKDAKRTRVVLPLLIAAERCLLLKGTPAFAKPRVMSTIKKLVDGLYHIMLFVGDGVDEVFPSYVSGKWGLPLSSRAMEVSTE